MKFIQAAHRSGTQHSVSRIVIHATVSPCVRGGAVSVGHYFQTAGAGGSAHYVVDPGEIVACVKEDVVAWHAPPNTGSIGVELCDPQKGSAARWQDDAHQEMLKLAAGLVRRVAARWNVPLRRLTVSGLKAGLEGICGHVDVSNAFHQTDHSDPGTGFPWDQFMAMVRDDKNIPEPAAASDSWTEELVKDLPLLKEGADNFDVKTVRALLVARGGKPEELDLLNTRFTSDLTTKVKAYQKAEKLDVDGIVGAKSWAKLLRR
jgi:N-acetyl-anhydromuramyl-L-alanine amidase AmpD